MSSAALNNLWMYIEGLSLKQKDRDWLAGKLLNPTKEDEETARQKAYVKDTLSRAIREVDAAHREGRKLKNVDDFLAEWETEERV